MLFKQIPRTELAPSGLPPRITPPTTPSEFVLRQESTLVTLVSAWRKKNITQRGSFVFEKKSGARLAASWGWSKTRAENEGGGDVFSFFSLVCYLFSPSFLLLSFSYFFFFFFFSSWVTIDLVTPRENHRADGISSGSQQGCDRGGKLKSTRKKGPIIAFNQHHCWSSWSSIQNRVEGGCSVFRWETVREIVTGIEYDCATSGYRP